MSREDSAYMGNWENWRDRLNNGDTFKNIHFPQVRTKLAPTSSFRSEKSQSLPPPSQPSKYKDTGIYYRENLDVFKEPSRREETESNQERQLRTRLVVFLASGLLLIAITVITSVVVVTVTGTSKTSTEKMLAKANVTLTITNINYTTEFGDPSSPEFKTFETKFCAEIDTLYEAITDYEGCVVEKVEKGSIVVTFAVVFTSTSVSSTNVVTTLTASAQGNVVTVGAFAFQASTVIVHAVVTITANQNPLSATTTTTQPPTTTEALTTTATTATSTAAPTTSTSTTSTETQTTTTMTTTSTAAPTTSTSTTTSTTSTEVPTTSTSRTTSTTTPITTTSTTSTETQTTTTMTTTSTAAPTTSTSTTTSTTSTEAPTTSTSRTTSTATPITTTSTTSTETQTTTTKTTTSTAAPTTSTSTTTSTTSTEAPTTTTPTTKSTATPITTTSTTSTETQTTTTKTTTSTAAPTTSTSTTTSTISTEAPTTSTSRTTSTATPITTTSTTSTETQTTTTMTTTSTAAPTTSTSTTTSTAAPNTTTSTTTSTATPSTSTSTTTSTAAPNTTTSTTTSTAAPNTTTSTTTSTAAPNTTTSTTTSTATPTSTTSTTTSSVTSTTTPSTTSTAAPNTTTSTTTSTATPNTTTSITTSTATPTTTPSTTTSTATPTTSTSTTTSTAAPNTTTSTTTSTATPTTTTSATTSTAAPNTTTSTTTSTTKPTTTTLTTTTTESTAVMECDVPQHVYLTAPTSLTCRINSTFSITSIVISGTVETTQQSETGLQGDISLNDFVTLEVATEADTSISLFISSVSCSDGGIYSVTVNGYLQGELELIVLSQATRPKLSSISMVLFQDTDIVCEAEVGINSSGNSVRQLEMLILYPGGTTDILTAFIENISNCIATQKITHTVTLMKSLTNTEIKCLSRLQDNSIESETLTLSPVAPDLECESYTGQSGSTEALQCTLSDAIPIKEIQLTFPSGQTFEKSSDTGLSGELTVADRMFLSLGDGSSNVDTLVLTFAPVSCGDEGEIGVTLNGEISGTLAIHILANSMEPSLNVTDFILLRTANVSCQAGVGRGIGGEPIAVLTLEYKKEDSENFVVFPEDTETILMEDCSNTQTVQMQIEVDFSWNNAQFRCTVKEKDTNQTVQSLAETITVTSPGFNCTESVVTSLESSVSASCNLEDLSDVTAVSIIFPNGGSYESHSATVFTEPINIDSQKTLTVTFGQTINFDIKFLSVQCEEVGKYTIIVNEEISSFWILGIEDEVTRPHLPSGEFILYQKTSLTCTANVGRRFTGEPLVNLTFEIKKSGEEEFVLYTGEINTTLVPKDCQNTETASITFVLDEDHSGAEVRCVAGTLLSDVIQLSARIPELTCDAEIESTLNNNASISCGIDASVVITEIKFQANGEPLPTVSNNGAPLTGTYAVSESMMVTVSEESDTSLSIGINFIDLTCANGGEYFFTVNGMLSKNWTVAITSEPGFPELHSPTTVLQFESITVACTSGVGRNSIGDATASLFLAYNTTATKEFVLADAADEGYVFTSSIDNDNCDNQANVTFSFTMDENWNNAEFKCVTRLEDGDGSQLESDVATLAYTEPGLQCPGQQTGTLDDTEWINCTITGVLTEDISIQHGDVVLYQSVGVGEYTQADGTTSLMVIPSGLSLKFLKLNCDDEGTYNISLRSSYQEASVLSVTSPPSDPVLKVNGVWELNSVVQIGCSGEIGYREKVGEMYIERKSSSDEEFTQLTDNVQVTDTTDSCRNTRDLLLTTPVDESWRGAEIRCHTVVDGQGDLWSESLTVNLNGSAAVSFDNPQYVSAIGQQLEITCSANVSDSIASIEIFHMITTDNFTLLGYVSNGQATKITERTDISVRSDTEVDAQTEENLIVTFSDVQCSDEGFVVCALNTNQSITTAQVYVTGSPNIPTLELASSVTHFTTLTAKCTGFVGRNEELEATSKVSLYTRAPGKEFAVYNGTSQREDTMQDCNNLQTASSDIFITPDWNEVEFMCVTEPFQGSALESEPQTLAAAMPVVTCTEQSVVSLGSDLTVTCITENIQLTSVNLTAPDGESNAQQMQPDDVEITFNKRTSLTVQRDGNVTLTFSVSAVMCGDEGQFIIGVNDVIQETFDVVVVSDIGTPELSLPDTFEPATNTNITCSANVGRNESGNAKADLTMELKKSADDEFSFVADAEVTVTPADCAIKSEATLTFAVNESWENAEVRCVLTVRENGERIETSAETITVSQAESVSFTSTNQLGNYEMSHSMTCEATIAGLTKMTLVKASSTGSEEIASFSSGGSITTVNGNVQVNTARSVIDVDTGSLVVEFITLGCGDGGDYICTATGNITSSASASLEIQRPPDAPVLTIQPHGVVVSDELSGEFICESEVGVPAGLLVIQTTEATDEFSDLTLGSDSYLLQENDCSNMATIRFNKTFSSAKHTISMRCIVKDTELSSPEIPVNILPASICIHKTGIEQVPFDCHGYVNCNNSIRAESVSTCDPPDHCVSEVRQACVECSTIGGCSTEPQSEELTCDAEVTAIIGDNATLNCIWEGTDSVTSVTLTKEDGTEVFNAVSEETVDNRFSIAIQQKNIVVMISGVQCSDQQKYIVTVNEQHVGVTDLLLENPLLTAPTIEVYPDPPFLGSFVQVNCANDIGIPVRSVGMTVEQNTTDGGVFVTLTSVNAITNDDTKDCFVRRTLSTYFVNGDEFWNGTTVRCKTEDTSGTPTYSDTVTLVGVENPIDMQFTAEQYTVNFGESINITCEVTGDADLQNLTIAKLMDNDIAYEAVWRESGIDEWQIPGGISVTGGSLPNSGASLTLTIDAAGCSDQTDYMCYRNGDPRTSQRTTLTVNGNDC